MRPEGIEGVTERGRTQLCIYEKGLLLKKPLKYSTELLELPENMRSPAGQPGSWTELDQFGMESVSQAYQCGIDSGKLRDQRRKVLVLRITDARRGNI